MFNGLNVIKDGEPTSCGKCGKAGTVGAGQGELKRCSGCKKIVYCTKDCQVAHWKDHKRQCRELQAAELAETESTTKKTSQPGAVKNGSTIAKSSAKQSQQQIIQDPLRIDMDAVRNSAKMLVKKLAKGWIKQLQLHPGVVGEGAKVRATEALAEWMKEKMLENPELNSMLSFTERPDLQQEGAMLVMDTLGLTGYYET